MTPLVELAVTLAAATLVVSAVITIVLLAAAVWFEWGEPRWNRRVLAREAARYLHQHTSGAQQGRRPAGGGWRNT